MRSHLTSLSQKTDRKKHVILSDWFFTPLRFSFLAFFFDASWFAGAGEPCFAKHSPSNAKTNGRNADQTGCVDEVGATTIASGTNRNSLQCEAPVRQRSVGEHNSNVTMVYGTYNELVTGAYNPTQLSWGPHIVTNLILLISTYNISSISSLDVILSASANLNFKKSGSNPYYDQLWPYQQVDRVMCFS